MFSLFILLLIISFLCFFNQHCPLQKPFIFSIFSSAKVEIELDNVEGLQKTIEIDGENDTKEERIIYSGSDTIKGKVKVIIPSGKKLEHIGIKIELVGTIGKCYSIPKFSSFKQCRILLLTFLLYKI